MQKWPLLFALLWLCLDVCVLLTLDVTRLPPPLPSLPLVSLWGGAVVRALPLTLLALSSPPSWGALQSVWVLCLHFPAYTSLLWAVGGGRGEKLERGYSWERVFQGYVITLLARLYWTRYVFPLLASGGRCILFLWSRTGENTTSTTTNITAWRRLGGWMMPYSLRYALVLLLVLLSSYGEMALPRYTGRIADWITDEEVSDIPNAPDTPNVSDTFTDVITIMTLMTIASAVLECVCDLTFNLTMSSVHTALTTSVFQAVLKQEMSFFDATPTGELVSRITTDTNDMSEALSEKLSLVMWYVARFAFLLYFMLMQSWKMTLLTCMGLPIMWTVPELLGHIQQTIAAEAQELLAKANQVATETFSCIKTVRSFANEDGEAERYRRRLEDIYGLNKKEAAAYAASTWSNSMMTLAFKVCILFYGGMLVTRGAVSSGDLVSFVLYELQFTSAVEAVMRSYPEVKKAIGASEKIFEYLDRRPLVPPEGSWEPETLEGHIQFNRVTFSYPGKTHEHVPVLKEVSLEMKPGRVTALVGLNRSGKSTCVKLLERFYQPLPGAGEILLDGKSLHSYTDQLLHDQMAVVSQDCVLFARSVRENIKYGIENASDEDMKRAAKLASAHDFIMGLSNGYDTDAGEKGGQVAGGQKQRISIARALIRRPKILILDNATSDLDAENEHQVHQALLRQDNRCTVVLISNKMSVVEKADHIIVLNNGTVEEEGTHDQLMQKGGLYAELVEKQNMGFHKQGEKKNSLQ